MSVSAMAGEVVDKVAVVLLAGGVGSRMKAGKPKQFLELEGKTILRTSLDIFLNLKGVTSISVVLAEDYRDQLADVAAADLSTLNSIEAFFSFPSYPSVTIRAYACHYPHMHFLMDYGCSLVTRATISHVGESLVIGRN